MFCAFSSTPVTSHTRPRSGSCTTNGPPGDLPPPDPLLLVAQVHGGVLQAGGQGAGAGPRFLATLWSANYYGSSVADRYKSLIKIFPDFFSRKFNVLLLHFSWKKVMDLKDVLVGENDEWFSWLHPPLDRWPSFLLSCTSQATCTGVACTQRGHKEFSHISLHWKFRSDRRPKLCLCSGFIDFIVSPTLNVCGDVISLVAGRWNSWIFK